MGKVETGRYRNVQEFILEILRQAQAAEKKEKHP
jgi:hypothetical protein